MQCCAISTCLCFCFKTGCGGPASRVLLLYIIDLKAYGTVYLFHVVKEKTRKSFSFCKCEETFKEEKASNSFNKNQANVIHAAASERGSYVEQEKLIALDESMGKQDCFFTFLGVPP